MAENRRQYIMLISGLPALPVRLAQAKQLPITRITLDQRLGDLREDHADLLQRLRQLLHWETMPPSTRDDQLLDQAETLLDMLTPYAVLRNYVAQRLTLRSLLVALRRRRDSLPPFSGDEPAQSAWGLKAIMQHTARRWHEPDFGLAHSQPWLPEARKHLEARDAWGLEQHLMQHLWRQLHQIADRQHYDFTAVAVYLMRWRLLERWLSYDVHAARERFDLLAAPLLEQIQGDLT